MNDHAHLPRTAPRAIVHAPSPLQATRLSLQIDDLLATTTLEQHYANRENEAIEVTYTIALPTDAVLLDVEVEIAGRRLRGQVQPKQQAELRYEQALAEGHSAFSIRMVGEQLANIALGNLKPGETLSLRIVMAQWLVWNDDRVRLTLPTTIAPRYGQPDMQPVDQPQVDILAEHGFVLDGRVRGLLAGAQLSSATHRLAVRARGDGIEFKVEQGHLDRDIVIDLRDARSDLRVAGSMSPDLDGTSAAMISFCAPATASSARPVVAEIVVDCSGSMGGVSIDQTRDAVRAIVAQLTPADRINVLRFGSTYQWLLRRPQPATLPVQRTLLQGAEELQADLGGTELLQALNAGLDDLARVPATIGGERVLFIISDGEVWNLDTEDFLKRCARDRVRVFAVAVGSAAVETTFAPLTQATGGALERVLPTDAMAARIQRHFARVRSGALRELRVRWPGATQWTRGPSEVFPGDGVRLSAGLVDRQGEPTAEVEWLEPSGERRQLRVALTPHLQAPAPSTAARMLARERLNTVDMEQATRMAVSYQLITPLSAITLVLERAAGEQLDQLPALRVVPQMLAVGWGGTAAGAPAAPASRSAPTPMPAMAPPPSVACESPDFDYLDVPAFQLQSAAPSPGKTADAHTTGRFQRVVKAARMFVSDRSRSEADEAALAPFPPSDPLREAVIAVLLERFRARPELVGLLNSGKLTFTALDVSVSTAILNWLDARAERHGLDLESGAFWRLLVDEISADAVGAALREVCRAG